MNYLNLVLPIRPAFFLTSTDSSTFEDFYLELKEGYPENSIVKIRGDKSRTTSEFFTELGAVLQFPYYFGANWDALDDCLSDLGWISGYVLLIPNANLLLSNASERDFKLMLQAFEECNQKALLDEENVTEGDNFGFHVVMQETEAEIANLEQKLTAAGSKFEALKVEPRK